MICKHSANPPAYCNGGGGGGGQTNPSPPDNTGGGSGSGGGGNGAGNDPPSPTSGDKATYTLFIQYDQYSTETRWYIEDVASGAFVYEYDFYKVTVPYYNLWGEIDLTEGRLYRLGLADSYGDGMDGFVAIFKSKGGEESTLVEDDGNYEYGTTHFFTA